MASSLHTVHRPVALAQARSQSYLRQQQRQPTQSTQQSPQVSPQTEQHSSQHLQPPSQQQQQQQRQGFSQTSTHDPNHPHHVDGDIVEGDHLEFPPVPNALEQNNARSPSGLEKAYQFSPLDENDRSTRDDDHQQQQHIDPSSQLDDGRRTEDAGLETFYVAQGTRMREGEESEEDEVGREKKKELGEMLREVFRLPEVEEVVAEMPCWLLRSIREYTLDPFLSQESSWRRSGRTGADSILSARCSRSVARVHVPHDRARLFLRSHASQIRGESALFLSYSFYVVVGSG
jgi:hypothetical protein